ncbi:hypothetical protein O181_087765 [Austropuccinia psidii MF-1]|uniref:Uncharacterized protein n=1 Tax=Austropuccinia psidii MF-1 TaxID=1389203 RepID=A0A9Q3IQH9_9BASI|nr:hypothetical protein [Austropuccinia psidii MF-1]
MVHTRNGSNYSVQQDGFGQIRGKTKSRSAESSSRKTHLEDARVSPHSPRSVPTDFDVNSEPELIHDNISRAEPFSGGRNRNISMPIQKLVQSSQRRGVGNMPKPLAGGHELYLHIKRFLGKERTIELLGGWSPLFCKDKVKNIKNWLKNQSLLSIDKKKEWEMTPALETEVPVVSTSSRNVQGQAQRTSEEAERSQEPSRQGKRKRQLAQTLPTRVQDPQIGAFSHGQFVQYGQDLDGIHNQRAGKDEQDLSTEIIQEIHFVKHGIDVDIGKLDAKLTKITMDINDLNNNAKNYAEMHKSLINKLESLTSTCDRIESKYHVQDDEMEDLSIRHNNDQLKTLKDNVMAVVKNKDQFATNLARSESQRQKLKDEILAQMEQINKNYESKPHMQRDSTPLAEENLSVNGSMTPFLGKNVISAKDIPKLEEWPNSSGEGEYNHIEFIRNIVSCKNIFTYLMKL